MRKYERVKDKEEEEEEEKEKNTSVKVKVSSQSQVMQEGDSVMEEDGVQKDIM